MSNARHAAGLSRRDMLKAVAALPVMTCLPGSFARTAGLAASRPGETVLTVVQLTGGNDGLNTIVPYADDAYQRARPVLGIGRANVVALTERLGLHPALSALQPLWDEGELSIVQGVGYPDSNRSHFRSMEIWHTATTAETPPTRGWVGSVAEALGGTTSLPVARVGARDLPLALAGAPSQAPAIGSLEDLVLDTAGDAPAKDQRARVEAACRSGHGRSGEAAYVAAAYGAAFDTARELASIPEDRSGGGFPSGKLGKSLHLAARLIGARTGRVFYATQGGYDTHATQGRRHPDLLRELGGSLAAFHAQLLAQGDADRVVTLVFSEFGRRIHENASAGTDHGAGNPVLVLGRPARGGVLGEDPDLSGAMDEDVPVTTDFRRVYASLLDWLDVPAADVLPGRFEALPLLA